MKERPILFSAPMVRAILEGRKSMTRRTVKPWPLRPVRDGECGVCEKHFAHIDEPDFVKLCPYGIPGDRLWVREAFRTSRVLDHLPPRKSGPKSPFWYEADGGVKNNPRGATGPGRYRHARFMPRWASRILLEITDVRVERLQEISEADAKAEGLSCLSKDGGRTYKFGIADGDGLPGKDDTGWHWADWEKDARRAFFKLWDNIHGDEHGAGSNPYVWVVCFKVLK